MLQINAKNVTKRRQIRRVEKSYYENGQRHNGSVPSYMVKTTCVKTSFLNNFNNTYSDVNNAIPHRSFLDTWTFLLITLKGLPRAISWAANTMQTFPSFFLKSAATRHAAVPMWRPVAPT